MSANRTSSLARLCSVLLLPSLLVSAPSAPPRLTNPSSVPPCLCGSVLAQSPIVVKEQDAAPDFPKDILFTLKTSGFLAEKAELDYSLVGEEVTVGVGADMPQATDSVDTSVTLDLTTDYIPPG